MQISKYVQSESPEAYCFMMQYTECKKQKHCKERASGIQEKDITCTSDPNSQKIVFVL